MLLVRLELIMRKAVSVLFLKLLLTCIMVLVFNVQWVEAERTIVAQDDYPTIQAAINAANEGDTIFARIGTYYEHVVSNKTVCVRTCPVKVDLDIMLQDPDITKYYIYTFFQWEDCSKQNTITITLNNDKTLTAYYKVAIIYIQKAPSE